MALREYLVRGRPRSRPNPRMQPTNAGWAGAPPRSQAPAGHSNEAIVVCWSFAADAQTVRRTPRSYHPYGVRPWHLTRGEFSEPPWRVSQRICHRGRNLKSRRRSDRHATSALAGLSSRCSHRGSGCHNRVEYQLAAATRHATRASSACRVCITCRRAPLRTRLADQRAYLACESTARPP